MRTIDEHPQTDTERQIFDILVKAGYKPEEIQFRGDNRYLRYGYWKRIDSKTLASLSQFITETDFDDDDCGTLFLYPLKDAA